MKILYLSYDGMSDPLGQSQVLPYLVGLSKLGFKFHLISFEKKELLYKSKKLIQEICDVSDISWYPLDYTKKPPVLSTINDLRKMIKLSRSIVQKEEVQIIHARGHLITSIAAEKVIGKKPLKYVFDMRGFWADERVEGGLWSMNNPLFRRIFAYFKRKELDFISKADAIITLTDRAKEMIVKWQKKKGIGNAPIVTIPCCADLGHFNYENYSTYKINQFKSTLNIEEETIVFSYLGSVGTWYMLPEMLKFFGLIHEKKPKTLFLFITKEPKETIYLEAAKCNIPEASLKIVSSERSEVPNYLSICDYSMFFIRPTFSKSGSSPVKHGEALGMGLPIICNHNIGDVDNIVRDSKSGFIVDVDNDTMNLGSFVPQKLSTESKKINRAAAEKYYNLEKGIQLYSEVYKKILKYENN